MRAVERASVLTSSSLGRAIAGVSVIVMFANDHFFKQAWQGVVTGKVSDICGMIFFPVLLHALVWMSVIPRARRDDARLHDRVLLLVCIATVVVFTLTKTTVAANDAYRFTWGAMQWPLRGVRALMHGAPLPGIARVVLVRDPSDLLAVPFVILAYRAGVRRERTESVSQPSQEERPSRGPSRNPACRLDSDLPAHGS